MEPASLLFRLQHYNLLQADATNSIAQIEREPASSKIKISILIIALTSHVQLTIDHMMVHLRQGGCVLLHSTQQYCLSSGEIIRFDFQTLSMEGEELISLVQPPLLRGYTYNQLSYQIQQVLGVQAVIGDRRGSSLLLTFTSSEHLLMQGKLQLILSMLVSLDEQTSHTQSDEKTIEIKRTITHIEQCFYEQLTVERLAAMAGMVRWQYSQQFKGITGKKPIEYIQHVRIEHAKRLLSHSTEKISSIAQQVGFKDEYYFSRCFRKWTGSSPREYTKCYIRSGSKTVIDSLGRRVRLPQTATRVVASGTEALGELLTLGISPIGAAISVMREQVVYRSKLRRIENIGYYADPNHITQLQPELILLGNYRSQDLHRLEEIAPAIVLNNRLHVFERLRYFGQLFERTHMAEQWIDRYQEKVRRVRRQLDSLYTVGETAAVYLMLGDKYYIMGQSGLAATLYEALGFLPSSKVKHLIDQDITWIEIKKHQLGEYMGERNFVLSDQGNSALRNTAFIGLTSLANSKLIHLSASWNYDDPITRERLLDMLPYAIGAVK